MFVDIIAPWIMDAWAEALEALVFDVPRLDLTTYQSHALLAGVATVLLVVAWQSIGHVPTHARVAARALLMTVLLVPMGAFAALHSDEVQALGDWARVLLVEVQQWAAVKQPVHRNRPTSVAQSEPVTQAEPASPVTAPVTAPGAASAVPPVVPRHSVEVSAHETAAVTGQLEASPDAAAVAPKVASNAPIQNAPAVIETPAPGTTPAAGQPEPGKPHESAPVALPWPEPAQRAVTTGAAALRRVVASLTRPAKPARHTIAVFFGTDRRVDNAARPLAYTAERGQRLEVGHAVVTMPTARPILATALPAATTSRTDDQSRNDAAPVGGLLEITEMTVLPKDRFIQAASQQLARGPQPHDAALIFVHGFNTSFESAVFRAAQMSFDLGFEGVPFVYSWPSAGRVARYGYDIESAHQSAPYLSQFMAMVAGETGAKSVSLVIHGLGASPSLEALAALKGTLPAGVRLKDIMFTAPDIEGAAFASRTALIGGPGCRITLYASASDRALNISRRYTGGVPRAGDVIDGMPLLVPGVETVDVSAPGTESVGLNHASYVRGGALLADIAGRLGTATSSATPAEAVTTAKGHYLRYRPAATR